MVADWSGTYGRGYPLPVGCHGVLRVLPLETSTIIWSTGPCIAEEYTYGNSCCLHQWIFLVAVEALPLRWTVYNNMHLVVLTIQRLVTTFTAAEPATLVSIQRDVKCDAVEKHLSCHTIYPIYSIN